MKYWLIYEGSAPPMSFDGLPPLRQTDDNECAALFTAGRLIDGNYNIIVDDGRKRFYWNPPPDPLPKPQPNTPNNPYFGKKKLSGAEFVGLCIGVLGVPAANRITEDKAFSAIRLWVTTADVVIDPDDKARQFLQLAGLPGGDGYLTATLAADGQPLMTQAQRDAIMAAWK